MNYLNKLLMGVEKNSQLFLLPNKNFVLGLTSTEIKELKKQAILLGLIYSDKKEYFLSSKGKEYLKANPILFWHSQEFPKRPEINLECLKKEKMPPSVTKAIRDIAKSLLNFETLKENSLPADILLEIKEKSDFLLEEMKDIVLSDEEIKISDIFDRFLSYGLTKSIIAVLLLIVLSENKDEIAVYEKGQFQIDFNYLVFDRMIFAPQNFIIQKTVIEKYLILEDLSKIVLHVKTKNILNITKGLLSSIKKLDKYALNTERLSAKTLRFRNIIMTAKDPVVLFERDIPKVLINKPLYSADDEFVKIFSDTILELQSATSKMEEEIKLFTYNAFGCTSRKELTEKISLLEEYLVDSEFKVFFKNVIDLEADEKLWFRRIATFVNKYRVPRDWFDFDVADYKLKIKEIALRINAIQSVVDGLRCSFSDSFKKLLEDVEKLSKPEKNILLKKIVNE